MSDISNILSQLNTDSKARQRLSFLFDNGEFTEIGAFAKAGDNFSGVITAYGYVEGNPIYAFSQDIEVNSGALTKVQADKIVKIYDLAAKTGVPVVGIYDSFGADLSDGINAMTAYGELLMWASNLSGVVPQIAVVAGTCAGCAAMLAAAADFVVATSDSDIFVTPNTSVKNLAENSAKCGLVSIVAESDREAVEAAKRILLKLPQNNLSPVPMYEFEQTGAEFGRTASENACAICDADSIIEISEAYGTSAYTALASIGGATVGICATNKADAKLTADDCSKLARFVRTCDAFAVPVITLVDTEGFETSDDAEISGAVKNMSKLAHAYAEATTIKLAVVTEKAYGPAYIALAGKGANADMVFALPNAVISPLNPLTAVEFLSHSALVGTTDVNVAREGLAADYIQNNASAVVAATKGSVEAIVEPKDVREALVNAIEIMAGKRISRLPKKHSNIPM